MNTTRIGMGGLAAVVFATLLAACATAPVANGSNGEAHAAEPYSHDVYFY